MENDTNIILQRDAEGNASFCGLNIKVPQNVSALVAFSGILRPTDGFLDGDKIEFAENEGYTVLGSDGVVRPCQEQLTLQNKDAPFYVHSKTLNNFQHLNEAFERLEFWKTNWAQPRVETLFRVLCENRYSCIQQTNGGYVVFQMDKIGLTENYYTDCPKKGTQNEEELSRYLHQRQRISKIVGIMFALEEKLIPMIIKKLPEGKTPLILVVETGGVQRIFRRNYMGYWKILFGGVDSTIKNICIK